MNEISSADAPHYHGLQALVNFMGKHKGNFSVKFRYLIAPKEEDFVSHDIMNYTK